jgi:hypothetical protein
VKATVTIEVTMTIKATSVARIEEIIADAERRCQQVENFEGVTDAETFVQDWEYDDAD